MPFASDNKRIAHVQLCAKTEVPFWGWAVEQTLKATIGTNNHLEVEQMLRQSQPAHRFGHIHYVLLHEFTVRSWSWTLGAAVCPSVLCLSRSICLTVCVSDCPSLSLSRPLSAEAIPTDNARLMKSRSWPPSAAQARCLQDSIGWRCMGSSLFDPTSWLHNVRNYSPEIQRPCCEGVNTAITGQRPAIGGKIAAKTGRSLLRMFLSSHCGRFGVCILLTVAAA